MRILQAELDEANTAYKEIKAKLDNANEQIAQKEKQLADTEQSLKRTRNICKNVYVISIYMDKFLI